MHCRHGSPGILKARPLGPLGPLGLERFCFGVGAVVGLRINVQGFLAILGSPALGGPGQGALRPL